MEKYELKHNWRRGVLHDLYVAIAVDAFARAENAYIEINEQENQEPNGRTYELLAEIRRNCIETICFSVMALEAFINTFSAVYVSENFAQTIDHLDVSSKWIVTMQVSKGVELKKGEAPIQRLAKCVKMRNSFVHSKSTRVNLQEYGSMAIPKMNLLKDYMVPAYESLQALKDANNWLEKNWKTDTLKFDLAEMKKKDIGRFEKIENTWIFLDWPMII